MAGSPQLAKAVEEALRKLKDGSAGPEMAEMAREVLEGRTDLRSVARSSAYAAQISEGIRGYKSWEDSLSEEERNHLEEEARKVIHEDDE